MSDWNQPIKCFLNNIKLNFIIIRILLLLLHYHHHQRCHPHRHHHHHNHQHQHHCHHCRHPQCLYRQLVIDFGKDDTDEQMKTKPNLTHVRSEQRKRRITRLGLKFRHELIVSSPLPLFISPLSIPHPSSFSSSSRQSSSFFLSMLTSSSLLLERREPADVVPEVGGLALGFGQHEDLLLGEGGGQ